MAGFSIDVNLRPSTDVMVGIMSFLGCEQEPYNVTKWHANTPINNKSMYPWLYYTMWDELLQLNTEEHNLTQPRNDNSRLRTYVFL